MNTTSDINMNYFSTLPQDLLFQPFLVDDWLQIELEESGLILKEQDTSLLPLQEQQQSSLASTRRLVPIMPRLSTATITSPPTTQCPTLSPSSSLPSPPLSVRSPTTKRTLHDEPEDVLLKRRRNTDAARRSRLKKMRKMETLEGRVGELESENAQLNTRVAVLEAENLGLETKDKDLQDRIQKLEEQLKEARKALASKLSTY